jgi:hypothetical protein
MRLLSALLLLLNMQAYGQQVVIDPLADDPNALRFDPDFITRNRIATIRGEGMVKRDNQPMRDKNERVEFHFSAEGLPRLTCLSYGRKGGTRDTLSVSYLYDPRGRAVQELRYDANGAYGLLDSLDAEHRCIRRTYARLSEPVERDINSSTYTLISDERYRYITLNDTAVKRIWLNDQDLPYRERIFRKNEFGYLRSMEDRYLVTGRRGQITLRYSEKGRLFEREEQADLADPRTTKHVWHYDAAGNVLTCDQFQSGRRIKHAEYLYEDDTMFLKAVITKDEETGMIHVMRYITERR